MKTSDTPPTLPLVRLPRTVKDLGAVDVGPFLEVLDRLSDQFWEVEDDGKENAYRVFHHTQHVILRFLSDRNDARSWYERPPWTVVGPMIEPTMREIVAPYGLRDPQFPKAMFARLAPRSTIDRHCDGEFSNRVTHKIHVPLQTHPDVSFEVSGEFSHLAVGHAYEVNNVRPHGVRNPTSEPRVHFIFEVFDGAA